MRKILVSLIIFLFLSLLSSPFIALFLPKKSREHPYAELVYQVIATSETRGAGSEEEKILRLFDYVRKNISPRGRPYEGKPLDYLVTGRGWCDYQARALNSLLGRLNIASRYAMLVDASGSSPHTVNEILINGKWAIFDTMYNQVFKESGRYLDAAGLRRHPQVITSAKKIYLETLPFEKDWRRSTPRIKQYHILDHLIGLYVRVLGRPFCHFYQDCYLKLSFSQLSSKEEELFLKARHYHLLYRKKEADAYYKRLIDEFPQGEYAQESIKLRDSLERI